MRLLIVALSFLLTSCSNYTRHDSHECSVLCKNCEEVELKCKNGESDKIKVNEESDDE